LLIRGNYVALFVLEKKRHWASIFQMLFLITIMENNN
jgi:hypothetical protein